MTLQTVSYTQHLGQSQAVGLDFEQICDLVNYGLILLSRDMTIAFWNLWMEKHSRLERDKVLGRHIGDIYPGLEKKGFFWKAQNVLTLGNFAFFSQQMHHYVFPMPSERYLSEGYEYMQQNVSLAPVRDLRGQTVQVLVTIADDTNAAIYMDRLEKTLATLKESNRTDYLTKVANRRYLTECLEAEIDLWKRKKSDFVFIILDIDHFKAVNDNLGHQCGDRVLTGLADFLRQNLRPYDKLGRYGGEEFCIILPQTGLNSGLKLAERLRAQVAQTSFACPDKEQEVTVTISMGLTSTENVAHLTADTVLYKADLALYEAKETGRNSIKCRL